MHNVSRIPQSAQTQAHVDLMEKLGRHRDSPYRKPYADYNRQAFDDSMKRYQALHSGRPLILDAGCGTGQSSVSLARQFPDHYVIGVDQSAARLSRYSAHRHEQDDFPENLDLVRADLVDYWRLLLDAGICLDRHYLFYPNPWPKIGHLSRRWHGHPVFPAILSLGGVLECRTNWDIYIKEFSLAVEYLAGLSVQVEVFVPEVTISPFERKYSDSGHPLYRAMVSLIRKN